MPYKTVTASISGLAVKNVHNNPEITGQGIGRARAAAIPAAAIPAAVQMFEFLQSDEAQVILWTLGGAALCAIGVYVVKKFRDHKGDDQPNASELLTNFREIHSQGGLSDEEFRTIKAQLAARLEREINENDETG